MPVIGCSRGVTPSRSKLFKSKLLKLAPRKSAPRSLQFLAETLNNSLSLKSASLRSAKSSRHSVSRLLASLQPTKKVLDKLPYEKLQSLIVSAAKVQVAYWHFEITQ